MGIDRSQDIVTTILKQEEPDSFSLMRLNPDVFEEKTLIGTYQPGRGPYPDRAESYRVILGNYGDTLESAVARYKFSVSVTFELLKLPNAVEHKDMPVGFRGGEPIMMFGKPSKPLLMGVFESGTGPYPAHPIDPYGLYSAPVAIFDGMTKDEAIKMYVDMHRMKYTVSGPSM
jgi:hypothetical protein